MRFIGRISISVLTEHLLVIAIAGGPFFEQYTAEKISVLLHKTPACLNQPDLPM